MVRVASGQSIGERERQEDALKIVHQSDGSDDGEVLLMVSDGMGGHAGGDIASTLAIETFVDHFENISENMRPKGRLEDSVHAANASLKVRVASDPDLRGMGCTFLAVLIVQDRIIWCSVGDSVLFHLRNGQIRRLNADHSYFGELLEMVKRGEMTLEDARAHPSKNALRSAMTGEPLTLVDTNAVLSEPDDIIILASDGLETLSDDEIATITYRHSKSAADITAALLEAVEQRNRPRQDNTTLVVCVENGDTKATTLGDSKWALSNLSSSKLTDYLPYALIGGGIVALLLILFALFGRSEPEVVVPEVVPVPVVPVQDPPPGTSSINDSEPIEDEPTEIAPADPLVPDDVPEAAPEGDTPIEDGAPETQEDAIDGALQEALDADPDAQPQDGTDPASEDEGTLGAADETQPDALPDAGSE